MKSRIELGNKDFLKYRELAMLCEALWHPRGMWKSPLFPSQRGWEQKMDVLLYLYLSLDWNRYHDIILLYCDNPLMLTDNVTTGNATKWCWVALSARVSCSLFLWYHSAPNVGISLLVMKYSFTNTFLCCCVDLPWKSTCTNHNYIGEKEVGMILKVKLSLTERIKTSITVGWFCDVNFF